MAMTDNQLTSSVMGTDKFIYLLYTSYT